MEVKLNVEDAHGDQYLQDFEIHQTLDGFRCLMCPLCGKEIENMKSCAEGHIAYTIIEEEVDEKIWAAKGGETQNG